MAVCSLLFLALSFLLTEDVLGEIIVYPFTPPRPIEWEFHDVPSRFGALLPDEGMRALVTVGVPRNGCSEMAPPPNATDAPPFVKKWAVLIARYNCTFEAKIRNAQAANYDAVIVYNVDSDDLEEMTVKDPDGINIPSVFVSSETGIKLQEQYLYSDMFYVVINGDRPFNINTQLLMPFAIVVALCLIVMIVFMVVKCIKDRRRARRHRLPNRALKKIPICKFSKGDPYDTCAICLDDYVEGDKLRVLPCAHAYHSKCIDPWLTKNRRVCPVCKRRVLAAGERPRRRRRRSDSDTDTDDSTEPLVQPTDAPQTQGGTFQAQRENPFVRAARFMSRFRAGAAAANADDTTQAVANAEENQTEADRVFPEHVVVDEDENASPVTISGSCPEPRREGVVPFLTGVLNMSSNHFGRGGGSSEETEQLLPATGSVPDCHLESEAMTQPRQKNKAKKNKSRTRSRQRSSSETTPRPTSSSARDPLVVSAEHSINRENTSTNTDIPNIGVAALPNPQFSKPGRRDDFVI